MAVNISATFTKEQKPRNGLEEIANKLVDEDLLHAQYFVVATVRPKRVAVDAEDGVKTPTIRFDHIEVLVDESDIDAVRALLKRRLKDRTGLEDDEPASLFDVLPGSGEQDGEGERQVPEAGAEELLAEHREEQERKAAAGAPAFSGGESA